jgi:hypothetical protein
MREYINPTESAESPRFISGATGDVNEKHMAVPQNGGRLSLSLSLHIGKVMTSFRPIVNTFTKQANFDCDIVRVS